MLDPGIGFAKSLDQNVGLWFLTPVVSRMPTGDVHAHLHQVELLRRLDEVRSGRLPMLVGPSRKGFLGRILEASGGTSLFCAQLSGAECCVALIRSVCAACQQRQCTVCAL